LLPFIQRPSALLDRPGGDGRIDAPNTFSGSALRGRD
jgi:hypothetical protein